MTLVDRASSVFSRALSAARNMGARRPGPSRSVPRRRPSGRLAVEILEDRMCPTTLEFLVPFGTQVVPGVGHDVVEYIAGPAEFIDAGHCVGALDTALRPVQTVMFKNVGSGSGSGSAPHFIQIITLRQVFPTLAQTTAVPSGTRLVNLLSQTPCVIGDTLFDKYWATVDEPGNLLAAAVGGGAGETVTQKQVQPLLTEAVARWAGTGVDAGRLADVRVHITDLPGAQLGMAAGDTIWLDRDAAGWGWFVDRTPHNDSEFTRPGNQGKRNRMDLLTVLAHEIGHMLGKEHEESGVMIDTLLAGTRRTPGSAANLSDWSSAAWLAVFADLESPPFHKRR